MPVTLEKIARQLHEEALRHRRAASMLDAEAARIEQAIKAAEAAADRKPGAVEKLVKAVLGDGEEED